MGCLAGLRLARAGHRVTILERRSGLLEGASRNNEGKIHRGYTYGLEPTRETSRLLAAHGASFPSRLEEVIGPRAAEVYLHHRQWYAVPRASALDAAGAERHLHAVAAFDPEGGPDSVTRVGERELRAVFSDEIVAAFEVPESSINCQLLCDLVREAVGNERIVIETGIEIGAIEDGERPLIRTADGREAGRFDVVINAAWDGMPEIERRAGAMGHPLCLRAKVGFMTKVEGGMPERAVTFVYGAFGDVVPQNNGVAYVSWYPSALMAMTTGLDGGAGWLERVAAGFDFDACYAANCAAFERLIPAMRLAGAPLEIRAGAILAAGETDISDPQSQLHGRARSGLYRRGSVIAVDTGKLTSAPALAAELAELLQ
jgi:hypothetical protein